MNELIQKISQEFSKGNFEFTYPHMSADIQWNMVGAAVTTGKEAVIANCNRMLAEMNNATLNNIHHVFGEDSAAVQGYCSYTKENNTAGRVEYCDLYRFVNDQLVEITSYCIEVNQE